MNATLRQAFLKTVALFERDPRVVAAYHSGSVGTRSEDEFSDVDPVFVIDPAGFGSFDRELRSLLEPVLGKAVLWWPERWIWHPDYSANPGNARNYAIFFEVGEQLLQYDINYQAAPADGRIRVQPEQIIFDKAGVLDAGPQSSPPAPEDGRLVWTIEMYWIYGYIHAKYLRRRDAFKLLYAQQELFQEHLEVLRHVQPGIARAWWPLVAHELDEGAQERLLLYFAASDVDTVARLLPEQLRAFSKDARAACAHCGVEYPDAFERAVWGHLRRTGVIAGGSRD